MLEALPSSVPRCACCCSCQCSYCRSKASCLHSPAEILALRFQSACSVAILRRACGNPDCISVLTCWSYMLQGICRRPIWTCAGPVARGMTPCAATRCPRRRGPRRRRRPTTPRTPVSGEPAAGISASRLVGCLSQGCICWASAGCATVSGRCNATVFCFDEERRWRGTLAVLAHAFAPGP